jgi:hypothetical protein
MDLGNGVVFPSRECQVMGFVSQTEVMHGAAPAVMPSPSETARIVALNVQLVLGFKPVHVCAMLSPGLS